MNYNIIVNWVRRVGFIAKPLRLLRNKFEESSKYSWLNDGFYIRGNRAMEIGKHEEMEKMFIMKNLENCDLFLNVGANIGYYCLLAASKGVKSIAVEPVQRNLKMLINNIIKNSFESKVEVIPLAVGDSSGIVKIYGERTGASMVKGWAGIPENYFSYVPMATLDSLFYSRLADVNNPVIVIDVEGCEFNVLKGSIKIISKLNCLFVVEICSTDHQPRGVSYNPFLLDTFAIFEEYEYRVFGLGSDLHEYSYFEIEEYSKLKVTMPHYTFVFSRNALC